VTDAFIDTNVLLYAASDLASDQPKKQKAQALLNRVQFGISVQVLQEFYVNAVGKLAANIPESNLHTVLAMLRRRPIVELTTVLFDAAVEIKRRYQISYWDAAIVAAAKELGAKTVYSEDLAHGQTYDGVQVVNPFIAASVS
jgi:predicted nucleic acid-binding protein